MWRRALRGTLQSVPCVLSTATLLCVCMQAVVAQVMLLPEAQQYVQQAEVPEELVALAEGAVVLLRLTDAELRQLLVEVPDGTCLNALDYVTEEPGAELV